MASILDLGLGIQGSDVEKAAYVDRQFRKSCDAAGKKRERLYGNLSYYFGDQIPLGIKDKLSKENRDGMVLNIAQRKVQGLTGSLVRNAFDVVYMSTDGKLTSVYEALEDSFKSDWNSGNCDYHWLQFIKMGLIEESVMELTTSTRESPLGNLIFECTQPGSVIIDQNWRTNASLDMNEAFKYVYLSPSQILAMFPEQEDELKAAILSKLRGGKEYSVPGAGDNHGLWDAVTSGHMAGDESSELTFNRNHPTTTGSDPMVLQYQYLEPTKSKKEIDMKSLQELPETEDIEYKKRWIELQQIDPDYIREITYTKKVCKVLTVIPALMDKPVQDKPHELQIERITFFPWSPERINGDTRSIIDTVKSLQDTINKRINMSSNIIENSANGAAAVDPAIVGNDPEKKKEIQANWSNPRFKFWTQAGALSSGNHKYFEPLPQSNPQGDVFKQLDILWDAIDRVLPVNAASDGRSESPTESGILYSYKSAAIDIAQTTLVSGLQGIKQEMGDAYFRAAKSYYSGVERLFTRPDGTTFSINEIIPLPSGDVGIRNDISSIQNVKCLVKMGQNSPNSRFKRRVEALDTFKLVEAMPNARVEVVAEIMDTLDQGDDYKARMAAALEIERKVAQSTATATIATNEAAAKQASAPPPPPQAAQKGPSLSISYKDLPPDGQVQAAQQAGIQIAPPAPPPPEQAENPLMSALAPLMKKG